MFGPRVCELTLLVLVLLLRSLCWIAERAPQLAQWATLSVLLVVLERTSRTVSAQKPITLWTASFQMVLWSSELKVIFKTKDFCFLSTVRQPYLLLSQEESLP